MSAENGKTVSDIDDARCEAAALTLTTPRLTLRPFVEEDAEELFACCRNSVLGDNAGWKPHETLEESIQILQEVFLGKRGVWAVCEREQGRLIGSVGLLPDPKRENPEALMLGYWLDEAYWGRGLMYEASCAALGYGFGPLAASVITACCYAENGRSKRLIERLGFRFEGMLHAAVRDHRGRTLDLLSYYLLREAGDSVAAE